MRCQTAIPATAWFRTGFLVLVCVAIASPAALAQSKNPGTTLSPPSAPSPYVAPPVRLAVPPPAVASPPATAEGDGSARRLAATLPLDPTTRDLRNRLPADVQGTIHRLGLREPHGTRTDLRGHAPTPKEIADALAH
jgi:hypothetical protein